MQHLLLLLPCQKITPAAFCRTSNPTDPKHHHHHHCCCAGDLEGAARVSDAARRMDLADRYLNCTAVKALFRAGHVSLLVWPGGERCGVVVWA